MEKRISRQRPALSELPSEGRHKINFSANFQFLSSFPLLQMIGSEPRVRMHARRLHQENSEKVTFMRRVLPVTNICNDHLCAYLHEYVVSV